MKKVDWKDVWSRAWKTFLQTAGSYLIAKVLLLGVSAIMNYLFSKFVIFRK